MAKDSVCLRVKVTPLPLRQCWPNPMMGMANAEKGEAGPGQDGAVGQAVAAGLRRLAGHRFGMEALECRGRMAQ